MNSTQIRYLHQFESLIIHTVNGRPHSVVRQELIAATQTWSPKVFARGIRAASSVVEKDTDRRKEGILK